LEPQLKILLVNFMMAGGQTALGLLGAKQIEGEPS